ncbi:MAG TPA: hypothetical protein VNR00_14710 [Opitutus sp.]|nr:hypothetical protein [Opitutus sp.]
MRLLSFLTDIERAVRLEANAGEGAIWNSSRIINFRTGLARLTLNLRERDSGFPEGSVIVQYFGLADGSFCLKASLAWQGTDAAQTLSVYDTPLLNWKLEASRIAAAWLAGPPAAASIGAEAEPERVAVAS